jgi:hypothetical protein
MQSNHVIYFNSLDNIVDIKRPIWKKGEMGREQNLVRKSLERVFIYRAIYIF